MPPNAIRAREREITWRGEYQRFRQAHRRVIQECRTLYDLTEHHKHDISTEIHGEVCPTCR